jgi:hypothetical protein
MPLSQNERGAYKPDTVFSSRADPCTRGRHERTILAHLFIYLRSQFLDGIITMYS